MAREDVYKAVSRVVPCCHLAYPKGAAPELPWAVFYEDDADEYSADDDNLITTHNWIVELYEKAADAQLESTLRDSLRAAFGPVRRGRETWIESEGCMQSAYYFSEMEGLKNGKEKIPRWLA